MTLSVFRLPCAISPKDKIPGATENSSVKFLRTEMVLEDVFTAIISFNPSLLTSLMNTDYGANPVAWVMPPEKLPLPSFPITETVAEP